VCGEDRCSVVCVLHCKNIFPACLPILRLFASMTALSPRSKDFSEYLSAWDTTKTRVTRRRLHREREREIRIRFVVSYTTPAYHTCRRLLISTSKGRTEGRHCISSIQYPFCNYSCPPSRFFTAPASTINAAHSLHSVPCSIFLQRTLTTKVPASLLSERAEQSLQWNCLQGSCVDYSW